MHSDMRQCDSGYCVCTVRNEWAHLTAWIELIVLERCSAGTRKALILSSFALCVSQVHPMVEDRLVH